MYLLPVDQIWNLISLLILQQMHRDVWSSLSFHKQLSWHEQLQVVFDIHFQLFHIFGADNRWNNKEWIRLNKRQQKNDLGDIPTLLAYHVQFTYCDLSGI